MKIIKYVVFMTSILIITSCTSTIETTRYDAQGGEPIKGLSYYLPMTKLRVIAIRKPVKEDNLKKLIIQSKKSKKAVDSAKEKIGKLKEAHKLAFRNQLSTPASGLAEAKKKSALLLGELTAEKINLKKLEKKASDDKDAVAKAELSNGIKLVDSIKIELLPAEPDTSMLYSATLDHSWTSEDTLKINTTSSGLLSSVVFSSEDKTPEIIKNTAKLIIAAFKIAAGIPTSVSTESSFRKDDDQCKSEKLHPFVFDTIFDPNDSNEIITINNKLQSLCTKFQISVSSQNQYDAPATPAPATDTTPATKIDGLLYKRLMPHIVVLSLMHDNGNYFPLKSEAILIPNNSPIFAFPLTTGMLVETNYNITFVNGIPTSKDSTHPSEGLALIQIPLDIAESIISLPSELLQLKIDYSSKEASLIENQKITLESQEALKTLIKEIQADSELPLSEDDLSTEEN